MTFHPRDRDTTGRRTYDDNRELAVTSGEGAPWIGWVSDSLEHSFTRAGLFLILGTTIVGSLAYGAAQYSLRHNPNPGEGRIEQMDLEMRDRAVETARHLQSLLGALAQESSYQKDEKGKFHLVNGEDKTVDGMVAGLSETWPSAPSHPDIILIKKLLSEGLTAKEFYKAYDGLSRKYNNKLLFERRVNQFEDLSALTAPPRAPALK